jgi:hypothetical protein
LDKLGLNSEESSSNFEDFNPEDVSLSIFEEDMDMDGLTSEENQENEDSFETSAYSLFEEDSLIGEE